MAKPSDSPGAAARPRRGPRPIRMFTSRPRLTAALAAGVLVGTGCALFFPRLQLSTCFIVGWDTLCVTFLASVLGSMMAHGPDQIRAHAARDDEGRGMLLALMVVAAAVSVGAIAHELSLARLEHGWLRAGHVAFAFATVAASWAMMQMIFALHYAHEYYGLDKRDGEGDAGGLLFPGGEEPDYWDFVHFSVVIGVACQTADVAFTSKTLRRVGTVHGVVAFVFNTLIVALTINLLASLF